MIRKYVTAACIVFLTFVGASANAEDTADEAKVAAATRQWIETFNTRDAARITALYAPDAVLWGTVSQTIRTTHDEILEYFIDSSKKRPRAGGPEGRWKVAGVRQPPDFRARASQPRRGGGKGEHAARGSFHRPCRGSQLDRRQLRA